jgi:2-C-methyl-D-erythritol 2,4-cyclodiphosphate synthase
MRVGLGYDVHKFSAKRRLVLGGVEVKHKYGLEGHSDADVICHALIDALLGASGAGDIGDHFPNTDPQYKDASSLQLLAETVNLIGQKNYAIINADIVLLLETPKISAYKEKMKVVLAKTMGISPEQVNIKATTNEKLGFIGRQEGAAALAVVLLSEA